MSGAEEAGGGGPAAGPAGAVPAGVGVGAGPGAAAGPAAAALGEAAGPGLPDEAGLAGARQLQEAAGDPDAPPKKRLRAAEAAEAAAAAVAAGSGKLEERLYSVLCCTVCLDLPKASVYQVGPPARPGTARRRLEAWGRWPGTLSYPDIHLTGPRNPAPVSRLLPFLALNLIFRVLWSPLLPCLNFCSPQIPCLLLLLPPGCPP